MFAFQLKNSCNDDFLLIEINLIQTDNQIITLYTEEQKI